MEITRAFLLRRIKLTESSLILTWLTASHGLIKTVAKGARSQKSKFHGRIDLFFDCEIQFSRARRGDLHSLCEVTLCNAHEGLRHDYLRVRLASYWVELVEALLEPECPAPELHHLLRRALGHLSEQQASLRAFLHFEKELATLLGVLDPDLPPIESLRKACQRLPQSRLSLAESLLKPSPET